MKKLLFLCFGLFALVSLSAQTSTYAVVDSEKIYKSIAKYNQATISLDNLSAKYKAEVDALYAQIENKFTTYQKQKSSLSQNARLATETQIISDEKRAKELSDKYFGEGGELEKKSKALIDPIVEAVNSVISGYAKEKGILLVMEKDSEGSMIYVASAVDKTQEIIKLLNQ